MTWKVLGTVPGTKVGINKHSCGPGNMVGPKCQTPLLDRVPTPNCLFPSWFSPSYLLFHSKEGAIAEGSSVHVGVNVIACIGDFFHLSVVSLDAPHDWPCVEAFVGEWKGWCWRMESNILKTLALLYLALWHTGMMGKVSVSYPLPTLLSCARTPANLEQLLLLHDQRSGLRWKWEGLRYKGSLKVWCKSNMTLKAGLRG